jgi:hypothetical protein
VAQCNPWSDATAQHDILWSASKVMENAALMRCQQHFCESIEFIGT